MGSQHSRVDSRTPLGCILKHWDIFGSRIVSKKDLIFFCMKAWPKYSLANGETWPPTGSLNYHTISELDNYCRRWGRWVEISYIRMFLHLWDHLKNSRIEKNLIQTTGELSISDSKEEGNLQVNKDPPSLKESPEGIPSAPPPQGPSLCLSHLEGALPPLSTGIKGKGF